jgi:uncharacterized membrane protein
MLKAALMPIRPVFRFAAAPPGSAAALTVSLVFFVGCTWASYAHWANFEYRTFDLAYYVQGLSQLLHGRFDVSLLGVPLLGNHVEPIVFLFLPFFLLFRHPMVFVIVQNLALAAMGPLAFQCGRRLGLNRTSSMLLASAILLTPATGYVALHEFHPEALAAPFILLMIDARLRGSLRVYWTAVIALLACKENMALLVAGYCAVHLVLERKRGFTELRRWYVWPLAVSIVWFGFCTRVITPMLNSGGIDYPALYSRLGASPGEIFLNAIIQPQRILTALGQSLHYGNLLWALLLPFLGLPLLRLRWLLIAAPIVLQHLLSWRSSEWQIYFHYAAPLIPLFWIGLAQGVAGVGRATSVSAKLRGLVPLLVVIACLMAQIFVGPAGTIAASVVEWSAGQPSRARKLSFLNQIPSGASVVAPLPYLSHLAMREKLFSLHFILKGLKTLSRSEYEPPPPTDFVLIDYDDSATFDAGAGYYHPTMRTVDNRLIPSSDQLLHDFLRRSSWTVTSSNELTLFRNGPSAPEVPATITRTAGPVVIDPHTILNEISTTTDVLSQSGLEMAMKWSFQDPREIFPWMLLRLTPQGGGGPAITIPHGLCGPEWSGGDHMEKWRVVSSSRIPPGDYDAEALFVDYARILWAEKSGDNGRRTAANLARVSLGQIRVARTDALGN